MWRKIECMKLWTRRPLLEIVSLTKVASNDGTTIVAAEMGRIGPDWGKCSGGRTKLTG